MRNKHFPPNSLTLHQISFCYVINLFSVYTVDYLLTFFFSSNGAMLLCIQHLIKYPSVRGVILSNAESDRGTQLIHTRCIWGTKAPSNRGCCSHLISSDVSRNEMRLQNMTTATLLSEWRKTLLAEQMVVMMGLTIQPEEGINKLQKDSV